MDDKKAKGKEGLDKILEGELEKGNTILLRGTTGTGKTLFSLSVLTNWVLKNEKNGLYLGVNEPITIVEKHFEENDFLNNPEKVDLIDLRKKLNWQENSGSLDLGDLIKKIKKFIKEKNSKIVILDSIFSLYLLTNTEINRKKFIYNLVHGLRDEGLILIFISGKEIETEYIDPFEIVIDFIPSKNTENFDSSKIELKKTKAPKQKGTTSNLKITEKRIEIYPIEEKREIKDDKLKKEPKSRTKQIIEKKIKKIEEIEENLKDRAKFGASEDVIFSFEKEKDFNEFSKSRICRKNNIKIGEPKKKENKVWATVVISSPTGKDV